MQSITHILLSIQRKQLYKVIEIKKALGMCRIKITVSNNSTLSLNYEFKKKVFLVHKTHYMILFVL